MRLFGAIPQVGPNSPFRLGLFARVNSGLSPVTKTVRALQFGLVHPAFMSLPDWADSLVHVMSTVVSLPELHGQDFERWASQVVSDPLLASLQLPEPTSIGEWKVWAQGVNTALASQGAQ